MMKKIIRVNLFICILICLLKCSSTLADNEENLTSKISQQPPNPVPSASYISLDGLSLIIVFDQPINMSASLEAFDRHQSSLLDIDPNLFTHTSYNHLEASSQNIEHAICQDFKIISSTEYEQQHLQQQNLIQGIQLCARILTRKTLKVLHRYHLSSCIWATQTQLVIKLMKPVSNQLLVTFQTGSLTGDYSQKSQEGINVQLNRLPLESLGVPLSPRVAVTGPNQVPTCGQFTLSANLWSPFGTAPTSIDLKWTVERLAGFVPIANSTVGSLNSGSNKLSSDVPGGNLQQLINQQEIEASKWRRLQELVLATKANNLVLDAQLLQFMPQLYLFHLTVTFTTSLKTVKVNVTHRVGRLDYETPIGTIYGTHVLAHQPALNTNRDTLLIADVQVPECANDIKQVGMYWQVSDSRVKFEQTYAPFYLAKALTLPEQSSIEFRLNLFYGIRVKRYSSTYAHLTTGDSVLESKISGGIVAMSVPGWQHFEGSSQILNDQSNSLRNLELYASLTSAENDKYNYQWSCFDGKTALSCMKNPKLYSAPNSTHYEVSTSTGDTSPMPPKQTNSLANKPGQPDGAGSQVGVPLIDRSLQTQSVLRLPLEWLESGSQLWIGLQRFDRRQTLASSNHQSSLTEYALVEVQPSNSMTQLSIGPVLVSRSRVPISIRNPLTGALILPSGVPIILVGRVGPQEFVRSLTWHSPNFLYPLHWTLKNETNPLNGRLELMSELHLNPNLLVENAHYQFQLLVCSQSGTTSSVSLSVDIVPGISQCQLEITQSQQSNSLLISVDYCNIPLDMSPVTYQIYAAETDEPISGDVMANDPAKDPLNETDEKHLATQMRPLTTPQLSPSFHISNSMALSLLTNKLNGESSRKVVARFGARVCDRVQSCRTFFSNPFALRQSQMDSMGTDTERAKLRFPQSQLETHAKMMQIMRSMIESSRKINLAGNSIAAISIASSSIDLGQKLLLLNGTKSYIDPKLERSQGNRINQEQQQLSADLKVRELIHVAIRDCLNYCYLSLQRHFHFTDSGQANLVTQTLAKILSLQLDTPIEYKFRAVRLIGQLTRRTMNEYINLKQNCLADMVSLQSGYEALFGAFNHYSLDMFNEDQLSRGSSSHNHNNDHSARLHRLPTNRQDMDKRGNNVVVDIPLNRLAIIIPNSQLNHISPSNVHQNNIINNKNNNYQSIQAISNNNVNKLDSSNSSSPSTSSSLPNAFARQSHYDNNNNNQLISPNANKFNGENQSVEHLSTSPLGSSSLTINHSSIALNRKRSEEAILAYLRSIRHAYRSLIAAAAIQLPLGDVQLLHYSSGSGGNSQTSGLGNSQSDNNNNSNSNNNNIEDTVNGNDLDNTTTTTSTTFSVTNFERDPLAGGSSNRIATTLSLQRSPKTLTNVTRTSINPSINIQNARRLLTTTTTTTTNLNDRRFRDSSKYKRSEMLVTHATNTVTSTISSDIVSSLKHMTSFSTDTIDIDLNRYGSISIRVSQKLIKRFRFLDLGTGGDTNIASSSNDDNYVRCTNDTRSKPATRCSSFILSVTSFAGKAPFRSLDDGQALQIPIVEISLLSPLDGSDLMALMDSDAANEFEIIVTFTKSFVPSEETFNSAQSQSQSHPTTTTSLPEPQRQEDSYKCYRFDENLDEWSLVSSNIINNKVDLNQKEGETATKGSVTPSEQQIITCSFTGLGAFGAFRGKPPPVSSPLSSAAVVGGISIGGLVLVLTILGCLASDWRRLNNSRRSSKESRESNSSSVDSLEDQHYEVAGHPEHIGRYERPQIGGYPLRK